jgi:hypothetical protein
MKTSIEPGVKERLKPVLICILAVAIPLLLYLVCYLVTGSGIQCTIYKLTGFSCPGCGMTRMVLALFDGNIYQSFRYNPYMFVSIPLITLIGTIWSAEYVLYNQIYKHIDIVLISYTASIIIFGILRNMNIFSWLAPTVV